MAQPPWLAAKWTPSTIPEIGLSQHSYAAPLLPMLRMMGVRFWHKADMPEDTTSSQVGSLAIGFGLQAEFKRRR
jgi:hypothetical protein